MGASRLDLIEQGRSLDQVQSCSYRRKTASQFADLLSNDFEENGATVHMQLEALRLPVRGADLGPLQAEPTAMVKPAQNTKTEVHILIEAAVETNQPFVRGLNPQYPAHDVEDAGFYGVGWIIRLGAEAQTITAVLFPDVFIEERIRQQRDDAADALFIIVVLLAMAGLLGGGAEQTMKLYLLQLAPYGIERIAVAPLDP